MKTILQTEVFSVADSTYHIKDRISNVLQGKGVKDLTEDLMDKIDMLPKVFKGTLTLQAVNAVKRGEIRLVLGNPKTTLPSFMPFLVVAAQGKNQVIIDLTATSFQVKTDRVTKEPRYDIDIHQLYSLLVSAYISLFINRNTVLPTEALRLSTLWWSTMFCKVLNRTIGLSINRERYEAFRYLAMRFYSHNILENTEKVSEELAESFLPDHNKSIMLRTIENNIASQDIDPYSSFENFCKVLFNNEITGAVTAGTTNGRMNLSTYISLFVRMYGQKSLFALASFPYFMYMIIGTNNADKGFNRRVVEDVMVDPRRYMMFMNSIYDITSL